MRKFFAFVMVFAMAIPCAGAVESTNRPAAWAVPMTVEGVPNLHKVSDTLYRSAQPTAEGMREIQKLGIKTVINLRAFHTDSDELKGTDMAAENIPMKTWRMDKEDAARFLRIATDPKRQPVLVHCQHGADRTGAMNAVYRIVVQKWTKEEALREMREGGYGFHEVWQNIPAWIDELNVSDLPTAGESK